MPITPQARSPVCKSAIPSRDAHEVPCCEGQGFRDRARGGLGMAEGISRPDTNRHTLKSLEPESPQVPMPKLSFLRAYTACWA